MSETPEVFSRLGALESKTEILLERSERVEASLQAINNHLSERKGERRVTLWLAGAVGGVISAAGAALLRKL